jgi:hypothetical protein
MTGDRNYLRNIVRNLHYLIIDEIWQSICAETGIHSDDDGDISHDFSVEDWWFD